MEQIGFIIIAFFCLFVVACPLITTIAARRRRRPQAAVAEPRAKSLIRARRKLSTVTACSFSVASAAGSIQRSGSHDGEINDARPGLVVRNKSLADQHWHISPICIGPLVPESPSRFTQTRLLGDETIAHQDVPSRRQSTNLTAGTQEDCEALTEVDDVLTINSCGHSFHSKCLISWFLLDRNDCPICRQLFYSPPSIPSRVLLRVSPPRSQSTGMWV
ncbi:unnamed protein product [Clonostachys chloroleuca]|uniref:RING-type domain-containing protein n=1 Tax=Clonostachys chloroleuca TaxID=1926264 RepID=A0AA35MHH6_9HYPO|nr:unnamed protein product [Clonostachys chloroleuca]